MKIKHTVISLVLALALVLGTFAGLAVTAGAEEASDLVNEQGLVENVEGGCILHCWCWSFNTIKENMQKIADAGYSAVQTSPINAIMNAENSGMSLYSNGSGKWYYSYQPTNYTIGNFMLGTEDEFKDMCETAHSYGVKVIVDIVANHTTGQKAFVRGDLKTLKDAGVLYHTDDGKSSDVRRNMTQHYGVCPDVNTQNKDYQNIILNFLKLCVADGADGFRYDMAKHIELPDDKEAYASDFWPTVLDNGSTFEYGEVLQSPYDRFKDYAAIMHVTASNYGDSIRSYFYNGCNNISASNFVSYNSNLVKADRLVTWVESHDTYANDNDGKVNSSASFWMSNSQVRRGWALIAARKDNTSLFFSRPKGSVETKNVTLLNNPRWGENQIGIAGDDNYFHPEVVAVNKFSTAMLGVSENIENIKNSKKLLMVSRGTRGAVIINNSDEDVNLDADLGQKTKLKNGTYTDAADGDQFYAYNGRLFGTIKAESVTVLYDDSSLYNTVVPDEYQIEITDPTVPATSETQPASSETQPSSSEAPDPTTLAPKAAKSTIYVGATTTIKPNVKNAVGATTYKTSNKSVATVSSKGVVKGVKAGSVTITVTNNKVSKKLTIKIVKKNQSMTVKASAKSVKYSKVKKAKQTVSAITVKNYKGSLSYKKVSGSAKLSVTSKGKIVVKKGTKKATYKAVVKVTAAGNTAYNSSTKKVNITVKVK